MVDGPGLSLFSPCGRWCPTAVMTQCHGMPRVCLMVVGCRRSYPPPDTERIRSVERDLHGPGDGPEPVTAHTHRRLKKRTPATLLHASFQRLHRRFFWLFPLTSFTHRRARTSPADRETTDTCLEAARAIPSHPPPMRSPMPLRCLLALLALMSVSMPLAAQVYEPEVPATQVPAEFTALGRRATRDARDIASSSWSIGCETLDRGWADYWKYRDWLGATGAKSMRLQAGWARCERVVGVYDFAWLDAIVEDARAQGVQPWLELSYHNPVYGGTASLGAKWPTSGAALAAWDRWVNAIVAHFRGRVAMWAVWNEPDYNGGSASSYIPFYFRTAGLVRAQQPGARLIALSMASIRLDWATNLVDHGIANGTRGLVDIISYHGYSVNPDSHYSAVADIRTMLAAKAPAASLMQGENGAQSEDTGIGAMKGRAWNELQQSKWNARRMLGDFCRGIPTNLFTLADYRRDDGIWNRKGQLRMADDLSVARPKPAWQTARHV